MKIEQTNESGYIRLETIIESRNIDTHSLMTDLSDEDKDEIKEMIRMLNAEIMLKLHRIPKKIG